MRLTKADIKGLSAIQTRMALILLSVNGIGSAREFIEKVKRGKMPDEKLQFFNPAEKEGA
jgi:hypothetical protein